MYCVVQADQYTGVRALVLFADHCVGTTRKNTAAKERYCIPQRVIIHIITIAKTIRFTVPPCVPKNIIDPELTRMYVTVSSDEHRESGKSLNAITVGAD
jgi:hypothetical protein